MKTMQYLTVIAAAVIGLVVGGCSLIPWGDVPVVVPVVVPPVATNAPAGQYVSAWKLDPVDGNKATDCGVSIT